MILGGGKEKQQVETQVRNGGRAGGRSDVRDQGLLLRRRWGPVGIKARDVEKVESEIKSVLTISQKYTAI